MAVIFAGCGSSQSKEPVEDGAFTTKLDGYQRQIDKVISENDELKSLKVTESKSSEIDSEIVYIIYMEYDGEELGGLMIKTNDKGYIKSMYPVASEQIVVGKISAMMTAAFMALDSGLSYEEADDIAENILDISLMGGDGVSKNGIKYDFLIESSGYYMGEAYPAENEVTDE